MHAETSAGNSVSLPDASPPAGSTRVLSIDAFRGFIMVVMALDHANDFIARGYASEFWGGAIRQFGSTAGF